MSDNDLLEILIAHLQEIKTDLKELQTTCQTVSEKQTIHNFILEEHHKRSTSLEERFVPIEDHVKFIRTAIKMTLTVGALAGAYLAISNLFT